MNRIYACCIVWAYLLLSGCGEVSEEGEFAASADGRRIVEILGNDHMRFELTEFTAMPGEPLRVRFRNVGQQPKDRMGHNWLLLDSVSETEFHALAVDAARRPPDYLPEDRSAVLAYTGVLGPGEAEEVDFYAPETPGEYRYVCTFPGHYIVMQGRLRVLESNGE